MYFLCSRIKLSVLEKKVLQINAYFKWYHNSNICMVSGSIHSRQGDPGLSVILHFLPPRVQKHAVRLIEDTEIVLYPVQVFICQVCPTMTLNDAWMQL